MYRRAATLKRSLKVLWDFHGRHERHCPICGQDGFFAAFGSPVRFDALCIRCGSLERHRQHALLTRRHPEWIDDRRLLHFAAEQCFVSDYRTRCRDYVMCDLEARAGALTVDICNMPFETESFDTIVCHQVLEHVVDDRRAVDEIHRVLKPTGVAIISTPVIETWEHTLRAPLDVDSKARDLYFGQSDHVRYYGRDFEPMLEQAGFVVTKDIAAEPEVSRYGLIRGGVIYVVRKDRL